MIYVVAIAFIIDIIIIIIGTATLYGSWSALKIFFSHPVLVPSHSWSTFVPIPSGFTSIIRFIISSFPLLITCPAHLSLFIFI
jgi:hypothetical protein